MNAQASSPTELPTQAVAGAASKLISATIGDIVVVMSRSPQHKHYSLADIEWKVLPPVLAGQAFVADALHTPTGARAPLAVVTWARVSDEVDARLRSNPNAPLRLRPVEWTSGANHWQTESGS